jgi:hypothetical protein
VLLATIDVDHLHNPDMQLRFVGRAELERRVRAATPGVTFPLVGTRRARHVAGRDAARVVPLDRGQYARILGATDGDTGRT